jgi:predicted transcriptional regulator
MIEQYLKEFGLTEKEILVYTNLLPLGNAPASSIAKRIHLPRTTTKFICDQLLEKGLVKRTMKGRATVYIVESPHRIVHILQEQQSILQEQTKKMNRIIPELLGLYNPTSILPKIDFFEGVDGLKIALEQMLASLSPGDEILSFCRFLEIDSYTQEVWENVSLYYDNKMVEKGIHSKILTLDTPESRKYMKTIMNKNLAEMKFIPSKKHPIPFRGAEITIYQDCIWTFITENNSFFSYLVHSKSISDLYRMLFMITWQSVP